MFYLKNYLFFWKNAGTKSQGDTSVAMPKLNRMKQSEVANAMQKKDKISVCEGHYYITNIQVREAVFVGKNDSANKWVFLILSCLYIMCKMFLYYTEEHFCKDVCNC